MPKTPKRSMRISDELWDKVLDEADDRGETATDVVIRALLEHFR